MRELPESVGVWKLPDDIDGNIEYHDIFTRDQVLAIQKQAYEDGLREAEDRSNGLEKTMQWHMKEGSGVSTHSEFPDVVVMNKSLYDLLMDSHEELTASQKRDE